MSLARQVNLPTTLNPNVHRRKVVVTAVCSDSYLGAFLASW